MTSGLAIYDTMQYVLNPVCTWCVGQAASMGSLLLAAGAPGQRHALPNARIMVHQPSGGARVRWWRGGLWIHGRGTHGRPTAVGLGALLGRGREALCVCVGGGRVGAKFW